MIPPHCLVQSVRLAPPLLACLMLARASAAVAQPPGVAGDRAVPAERRLVAARATGPIVLDGSLDEPAWSDAPTAKGFVQNEPHEGQPATFDTLVRVLYDDQALYFGVFAIDDEPSAIIVSDLKKDFNTASSDGFLV